VLSGRKIGLLGPYYCVREVGSLVRLSLACSVSCLVVGRMDDVLSTPTVKLAVFQCVLVEGEDV